MTKLFRPPSYKPVKVYASYIKTRSPMFKVHNSLAQAKSAVNYRYHRRPRGGVVYELIDSHWHEYMWVEGEGAEGAAHMTYCGNCDRGFYDDDQYLCKECR